MKSLIAALFFMFATPAYAAEITIKLTDEEQKNLVAILDAATKCGGVNMAWPVVQLLQKLQQPPQDTKPK